MPPAEVVYNDCGIPNERYRIIMPFLLLYCFCCKMQKWGRYNPAMRSAWFVYTWILECKSE